MLTKFVAAAALGVALIAAPALAQNNKMSAPSANKMSPPSTASTTGAQSASSAGLWQGSKLIGLNVYDPQNQKIGSIVQLMVDKEGKIQSVVIGVGGFLGMGERDVAVKFADLKWIDTPVPSNSSSSSSTAPRPATTTGSAGTASRGPATYPDQAGLLLFRFTVWLARRAPERGDPMPLSRCGWMRRSPQKRYASVLKSEKRISRVACERADRRASPAIRFDSMVPEQRQQNDDR